MSAGGPHSGSAALVTGGSQGLGLAIARELLAQGCAGLVIAGRDAAKGQAAAAELAATGADVRFVAVDMAEVGAVRAMVAEAERAIGPVNVLVNAAADTARGSVLDTDEAGWDRIMAVNAKGPFFAIQEVANRAIAAGRPASIVNILSMVVHGGQSFLAPYSASKAALANVTKNAAQALRSHHIRVNGINVGWMNTPGEDAVQKRFHAAEPDWLARAAAAQPFGQLVEPDEVAGLAAYMLSPRAGVMTGALVDFDQNVAGAYPE